MNGSLQINKGIYHVSFRVTDQNGKRIQKQLSTGIKAEKGNKRKAEKRMQEILTRIVDGKGKDGDIELLEELCYAIKDGALCGLGQTAPNPVLTTIRYFRNEYEAHINNKKCPAHECAELITYSIDPDKCKGCTSCAKKCPVSAISGTVKKPHTIDAEKCIKCGQCKTLCRFGAVKVD